MKSPNQERCCEADGVVYTSIPPQSKCKHCGKFWAWEDDPPICHTQNHSTKEIPCVCGHWKSRHYPECDVGPDGCMKYQPDHSTMEGWEAEFNQRFGFGIWDSRAADGHRTEGIYSSDVVEFIRTLLAKERESAERRGREKAVEYIEQNPRVLIKALEVRDDTIAIVLEKGNLPADFLLTCADTLEAARKDNLDV